MQIISIIDHFKPMRAQTVILRSVSVPKVRQNSQSHDVTPRRIGLPPHGLEMFN